MATGVWAHGGGTSRLTNAEAGPYRVSVWTQPDPIRVGRGHFSVAVSHPASPTAASGEAGTAVLDAAVELKLALMGSPDQSQVVSATHGNAVNKLFYEADSELPVAGRWQVMVSVQGAEGTGSAFFEAEVQPPANVRWMVWAILLPVLGASGWWIFRQLSISRAAEPVDVR